MAQLIKKENITVSIRAYKDAQGNDKKVWKTVGELTTWQGDDGSQFQKWEMWGPTGSTSGSIFEQQDNSQQQGQYQPQQSNNQPQQGYNQQPQMQQPNQQQYQAPQQGYQQQSGGR